MSRKTCIAHTMSKRRAAGTTLAGDVHRSGAMPPTMGSVDLPLDVRRALDEVVESIHGLELFVLLCRHPGRTFLPDEIALAVAMPQRLAARALARLCSRGFAAGSAASGYCFTPSDEARARIAIAVVSLYRTRRIELVNHVASRQIQRIESVAESFRVHPGRVAAAQAAPSTPDATGPLTGALRPAWGRGG